jgi:hypothetical protein
MPTQTPKSHPHLSRIVESLQIVLGALEAAGPASSEGEPKAGWLPPDAFDTAMQTLAALKVWE